MENVCVADEDVAYNIYKEGKYFEGLPYFEIFKKIHRSQNIYVCLADRNLVKEMKFHAEYKKNRPTEQPLGGQFVAEPYDNYRKLLDKLIKHLPDFNMHLKANPKTNRIEFSVDEILYLI